MQRVVGWMVVLPVVLVFFALVFIALAAGAFMAGGEAPIPPWKW